MKITEKQLRRIIREELAEAQKTVEEEDAPLEEDDEPEATDPWRDDPGSGSPSSSRRPRRGSRHTHRRSTRRDPARRGKDWTEDPRHLRTWGESHERLVNELGIDRMERSGPSSQNLTATAPTKTHDTNIGITADDLVIKVAFEKSYTLHLDADSADALGNAILDAGNNLRRLSSATSPDSEGARVDRGPGFYDDDERVNWGGDSGI